MKFALVIASSAVVLAGCATQHDPVAKDVAAYVAKPDYDHAMVCDTRFDDLKKCEATLKQLCGDRGFVDLRIRPLREPGVSVDSATLRLLQLQCKARPAK